MNSGHASPKNISLQPLPLLEAPSEIMDETQGRWMQVKVLYTFDNANKTNCLARCPQPLNVQTAQLDESTQIGIIELRTCVQAIVGASPELVAELGQDYTVYAYDYSEYETPLVGQGMLSWVLASASATPAASAYQSRTMVTGRVCKNILGIFSAAGIKETLEVKLRLVPVPTCLQSEYVANMQKYHDLSSLSTRGFDAAAWTAFLRDNPLFGSAWLSVTPQTADGIYTGESYANEAKHGTSTVGKSGLFGHNGHDTTSRTFSADVCETGKSNTIRPVSSQQQQQQQQPRTKTPPQPIAQSRPSSRTSQTRRSSISQTTSCLSSANLDHMNDETEPANEPCRKRACITKADWHGPSTFDSSESLRVTASTAASIRGHRLSTSHLPTNNTTQSDGGVRPPTPRPRLIAPRPQASLLRKSTAIAHEVMTHEKVEYISPYTPPKNAAEASSVSPTSADEYDQKPSAASTPFDIPSSPPVMRTASAAPSSPALPGFPNEFDSGFVSGSLEECLNDVDDEMRPLDAEDIQVAARYSRRTKVPVSDASFNEVMPGDPSLLPRKILPRPPPVIRKPRVATSGKSSPKLPPSRSRSRMGRNLVATNGSAPSSPKLPELLPESMAGPGEDDRHQSESFSEDPFGRFISDAATDEVQVDLVNKPRRSNHLKKKTAIQEKLASSIAAGAIPRFCNNCGEVDTPTWRKAFVRIENGNPDHLHLSDDEEGFTAWDTISRNDDGEIISYRIIRKWVPYEEFANFTELSLCNPCGIWLWKFREMRPPQRWTTNSMATTKKPPAKRKRPPTKKQLAEAAAVRQSSEAISVDAKSGDDPSVHKPPEDDLSKAHATNQTKRLRASSLGPRGNDAAESRVLAKSGAAAALLRAIQSSPPQFPGSKHSPIELDLDTPAQPTRRLLFPSPRRPDEIKSLESGLETRVDASLLKQADANVVDDEDDLNCNNKENLPPAGESEDGLSHLCDADKYESKLHTPKSEALSFKDILRTPLLESGRNPLSPRGFLSSAARRWREAPETPSKTGNSVNIDVTEISPFTAQLTQLLSEANRQSPCPNTARNTLTLGTGMSEDDDYLMFSDFAGDSFGTDLATTDRTATFFSLYEDPVECGDDFLLGENFFDQMLVDPPQGAEVGAGVDEQNGE